MMSIGTPLMWMLFAAFVFVALAHRFLRHEQAGRTQGLDPRGGDLVADLGDGVVRLRGLALVVPGRHRHRCRGTRARHAKSLEFITGYLVEKALAVDNIFVFLMVFTYFAVPPSSRSAC
jgi:tellurite resistance protein TerC